MADVEMDINQTRRDVQAGSIDNFPRLTGGNIFFHGRDLVLGDRNIHHSVQIARGINYVAAFQQQVITGRLR